MNRKTFLTSILAGIGLTVKAKEVAASTGVADTFEWHYKNVVLENEILNMEFVSEVGGYLNHNKEQLIARVHNIRKSDASMLGDVIATRSLEGLYPSLGIFVHEKDNIGNIVTGHIENIGFCDKQNIDPNIKPIGDPYCVVRFTNA